MINAQESKFFLKKRDTLYVYFNDSIKGKNIITFNHIIKSKNSVGMETIYKVCSDTSLFYRNRMKNKIKEALKRGLIIGASGQLLPNDYGVDFIRYSNIFEGVECDLSWYNKYYEDSKKEFLTTNIYKNDSISFDKRMNNYININPKCRKYNSLIFTLQELKNKNVFILGKTEESYHSLNKLVTEKPLIIFFYREETQNEYNETIQYIFDEVVRKVPSRIL